MPKSKRNKVVHLTQVKKKGKDHKEDLLKQLEQLVAKFKRVYIFDFEQAKSDRIMALRLKLKSIGKIFSGKNSLVSLTLKTIGSKSGIDYEDLIKQVSGHRGLLFTDVDSSELIELLDKELPEFCKKLLGYSQLVPPARGLAAMEVDNIREDGNNKGVLKAAASAVKTKRKDTKKSRKAAEEDDGAAAAVERREVKFVKL